MKWIPIYGLWIVHKNVELIHKMSDIEEYIFNIYHGLSIIILILLIILST